MENLEELQDTIHGILSEPEYFGKYGKRSNCSTKQLAFLKTLEIKAGIEVMNRADVKTGINGASSAIDLLKIWLDGHPSDKKTTVTEYGDVLVR